MEARASITVNAPAAAVYSAWRDLEKLPTFMCHLDSVTRLDDTHSHWVAKAPGGPAEWDAELVQDVPGTCIAWRSVEGAEIPNDGQVTFVPAPGDRGTEVHVELHYSPPLGALGSAVAKLFGEEPNQQVRDDLRRFKQIVETGEIARSEGAPEGVRTKNIASQREATPFDDGRERSDSEVRV